MNAAVQTRDAQESRIEEEPILGRVLATPDGRVHPLTTVEKLMLTLRLTSAKSLALRYYPLAAAKR